MCSVGSQEIRELRVMCNNVDNGCPWEGTVGTIAGHIKTCTFVEILCPNKCTFQGSELKLLKEYLNGHLKDCPNRVYACTLCGEEGTYTSITEEHDKVCLKKEVACAICSQTMQRGVMEEHEKYSCKLSCKYRNIGCDVALTRTDIKQHEENDNKTHLDLALEKMSLLNDNLMTLNYPQSFAFKVSGFSLLKQRNETFCSEPFYSYHKYKLRILVLPSGSDKAGGTHMSLFIEVLNGHYDNELQWPLRGAVDITLLNQLSDSSHQRWVVTMMPPHYYAQVGSMAEIHQFFPHSRLSQDSTNSAQYLLNDTLYFRVSLAKLYSKPWLLSSTNIHEISLEMMKDFIMVKNQEPVTLKLQDYSTVKSFWSGFSVDTLFTAGITVTRDHLHLSVTVLVCTRPFDHSQSTFSGSIYVELLNQLEDRNHYAKLLELSCNNLENGTIHQKCAEFIPVAALVLDTNRKTQYLKDDCIYFRVTADVDSRDRKPWLDCRETCSRLYRATTS